MARWLIALHLLVSTTAAMSMGCSSATETEHVRSAAGAPKELAQPSPSAPAPTQESAPCSATGFVAALPQKLSSMQSEAELEGVRASLMGCSGVGELSFVSGSHPTLRVELTPPLEALSVAGALGVAEPHLITSTVHQESFQLARADRAAAAGPTFDDDLVFGAWNVRAVAKRPSGPLPKVRFGPAPAYDLAEYQGQITHIVISGAQ